MKQFKSFEKDMNSKDKIMNGIIVWFNIIIGQP